MRALFGRKVTNLEELKDMTEKALSEGVRGNRYRVTREVILEEKEFQRFASGFLRDQPWIRKEDGGSDPEDMGALCCLRVIHQTTGEAVLVNPEGFGYCRYTALDPENMPGGEKQ